MVFIVAMRIKFTCNDCLTALRSRPGPVFETVLPAREDRVYRWTCPAGHEQAATLVGSHLDLLTEVAVQALADGYTREAYLSFMGAIERLMEAFVRAVWATKGVDLQIQDAAWKSAKNSSERQLGLFLATWTLTQSTPYISLPRWVPEERNMVVHQGKIPTDLEGLKFGQAAIDWMIPVISAGEQMDGWWRQYDTLTPLGRVIQLPLNEARRGVSLVDLLSNRRNAGADCVE